MNQRPRQQRHSSSQTKKTGLNYSNKRRGVQPANHGGNGGSTKRGHLQQVEHQVKGLWKPSSRFVEVLEEKSAAKKGVTFHNG